MAENEEILLNYLLSINNKKSEDLIDVVNQKENEDNDNCNIDNIKSNGQISFSNINNNNNILEKNNGIENKLNLPDNNEINKDAKKTVIKEISNLDIINSSEPKNNIVNINKEKDDDYNKCFKNRMDMMQAVLDDELNISAEENNFIRRRGKSRTTIAQKEYKGKKEANKKEVNIIREKEKEINENNYLNKPNGNEFIKQSNKEEIKNIDDNNYIYELEDKDKKIENNNNKNEFFEPSKIKEEKSQKHANLNKISEEIKLEIFNEKPIYKEKETKNSYIDINFHKNRNHKNNSERIKNKEKSEFIPINIENNNFSKINKTKMNYNKSYINIKDYQNNSLLKKYSALPISNKYYKNSNNKNNIMKINNEKNKIFSNTLDNLINKIKKNSVKKNSQYKNSNSIINQKIKDIKDSLGKITDDKRNKYSTKKNNALNNNFFKLLDDSFKIERKNFSRNFIFSKRTDSSDYIFQKDISNKNNISLPSQKISKKNNSNTNIYTLNNSSINNIIKNKKVFNVNNLNINNLQIMSKNIKTRNLFEELEPKNNILLKRVNISLERNNSKNNKEENKIIKNKNNILGNKDNKLNTIRLNYTSQKNGTKLFYNNKSSADISHSNFNSYINKINEKYKYNINVPKNYNINNKNANYISNKIKYIYNNDIINNKNIISSNNKKIQDYSQKSKDNYYNYNYQNYKSKDLFFPFEKLKSKKNHSIFPVNPFDSINYIKVNNFLNY